MCLKVLGLVFTVSIGDKNPPSNRQLESPESLKLVHVVSIKKWNLFREEKFLQVKTEEGSLGNHPGYKGAPLITPSALSNII